MESIFKFSILLNDIKTETDMLSIKWIFFFELTECYFLHLVGRIYKVLSFIINKNEFLFHEIKIKLNDFPYSKCLELIELIKRKTKNIRETLLYLNNFK